MAIDPDNLDASLIRAYASSALGDSATATESFERAITLEPENQWNYVDLAGTFDDADDIEGALAVLDRCVEGVSDSALCWAEKGTRHLWLDEREEAVAAWEQALEIEAGNDQALAEIMWFYWDDGDPDMALFYAGERVRFNSDDPWSFFDRALMYRDLGENELAAEDFSQYLQLASPEDCTECWQEAEEFVAEFGG